MISAKKKKNKNAKEKLCMKNKAEIDNYRMSLGEKKTNAKEKKKKKMRKVFQKTIKNIINNNKLYYIKLWSLKVKPLILFILLKKKFLIWAYKAKKIKILIIKF